MAVELQTALAKAERDLSFTVIRAPIDGVIGNRAVQVGDYVQPGSGSPAWCRSRHVYIDANFKETQLARAAAGPAGRDRRRRAGRTATIDGTVESVAPASGSVFSLLPPDNATGNFTKIVQRVPVRIRGAGGRAPRRRAAPRHVGGRERRHQARRRDAAPTRPRLARPHEAAWPAARAITQRTGAAASPPTADRIDPRRLFAFLCMVFGMFMAILDIQIVSASLAEIQAGLAASADEISWVQTAYLIAEVVMIPLSGFLSRALGTRWMFAISAGGFTLASLMCATRPPRSTR